ncbi:alpha/beta fold hydrolase [Natrialbaceae archaeon AArc-T1-2]|uniref:alpha/beta fold hydrolase n=1 Tax=Natrialbaceae archaeon AArc-T1-2 TaxID=3053904 RepID=UPI00255AB1BF|nr:alpha/beta hydrolase [Natrialbaceae archaeon AArc-T1-2]WIV67010.1 alpha/beta hydrolase [Natrialbaceae archaeon AArc-T1-2]
MPTASNDGVSLYYETAGDGDVVAFVPEAGLGGWSWGWQHAALAGPYEVLVTDLRGTGRSDTPPGPYDLEMLAADLEAVLADHRTRTAHVVGAGLGGAVALSAARISNRVETLTLFGTGARAEAFDLEPLFAPPDDPDALYRSLETAFSADFRERQPDVLEGIVDWRVDGDATRDGWESQIAALENFDATDWGYEVTQPTLVCHGTADDLVSAASGRELADALPRGEFEPLEAGHLCFVEQSRVVNDRLIGWLEAHTVTG